MDIGIIDADLVGKKKHRFPNLVCMKLSGYFKELGYNVTLLLNYDLIENYDQVYISKVFTDTLVPKEVLKNPKVKFGGTGFYYDKAPKLPYVIEHHMPDYHLYDNWVKNMIASGCKKSDFKYYLDYSIGFTTRGCFRKCKFCVNRNCSKVEHHALIQEFLDKDRKYICLLDDNVLGYTAWQNVLDNLIAANKPFQFKQGMDIRLLTPKKTLKLCSLNYHKDYIFAFDNIEDETIIRKKLSLWREYTNKKTKLYTFCGFDDTNKYDEEFWIKDLNSLFNRIFILAEYNCIPYVMRYKEYLKSPYKTIYNTIASWCNQPWALCTMTFKEFCIGTGMGTRYKQYKHNKEGYLKDGYKKGAAWVLIELLEKEYPDLSYWSNLNYQDFKKAC